jgi:1-acyl-sn-glycerol-3-phosphate acyltransferase
MLRSESGAAYLALVTGAPVLPLVFLGTRLPGGTTNSVPPRGTRVVMQYGDPLTLERLPWPRRQHDVRQASEQVRESLAALLDQTRARTGMTTPGPLPDPQTKEQL